MNALINSLIVAAVNCVILHISNSFPPSAAYMRH